LVTDGGRRNVQTFRRRLEALMLGGDLKGLEKFQRWETHTHKYDRTTDLNRNAAAGSELRNDADRRMLEVDCGTTKKIRSEL